jgi:hypothetical protein
MLSSTDDFPELWRHQRNGERLGEQIWAIGEADLEGGG